MQCDMNSTFNIELINIDSEDISDVLKKIEKSFNFGKADLINVKTFGELCDIVCQKVQGEDLNDCTTQQAFYRLRKAITENTFIEKHDIVPESKLEILFPKKNRRKAISLIEKQLGFKTQILRPKNWISITFILIFVISLIYLYFSWKVGVCGILISVLAYNIFYKFGKEFTLQTVKDVVQKISSENYSKVRSKDGTINKTEILQMVRELFSNDLDLDKSSLTRDARFG